MDYTKPDLCPGGILPGLFDFLCRIKIKSPKRTGEIMDQVSQPALISRNQIIDAFTHLRGEWEQALPGQNLVDVQCNAGLLMMDLAIALGLTEEERKTALGKSLAESFQVI